MKVKFTKLAALLLAGAALFATGCTDYEVDIQKVDKKVDDLTSGKVATLESQVAALQATVATLESAADHKADIDKLNKTITDLEAALQAAIALKVDQSAYDAKVAEIEKRIKDIEDKDFQKQIDDLITAMNNAVAQINQGIADAKDELEKKIAALETTLTGKIGELETRVKANEDAIKDIKENLIPALQSEIDKLNNEVIPAINTKIADLESGKLDKSEFDTYYKAAYEKYTKGTIDLMQAAIDKLTALTAGFPEDKTIKEYVDAADQLLADTFTAKYLELVAKAFGSLEKMNAMKGNLLGRLEACEALLAGEWGDKTVKEYIDGEVKTLNDKITALDEKITALTTRVETLEGKMDTVIDALKFCEVVAEDGKVSYNLQGYIDDADQALQDQIDEIWEWIEDYLIPTLNEIFADIYDQLDTLNERVIEAFQRIQSVQFVPEYDDLKITTNVAWVSQKVETQLRASDNVYFMEAVDIIDQPSKVTYQILPAQYAPAVAEGVEDFITDEDYIEFIRWWCDLEGEGPMTREEMKEMGITGILPFFNVKPLKTRDSEEEEDGIGDPQFIITGVESVDETSGEITFNILPVNVASAQYAANGLKPVKNVYMTAESYDPEYGIESYGVFDNGEDWGWYNRRASQSWAHYVYDIDELKAYEDRAAFAAQLRLYAFQDYDEDRDIDWDNFDWDAYLEDDDYEIPTVLLGYIDYENELASPYNVLYPDPTEIEILPDPYKWEENEDGEQELVPAVPEYQYLPYSALRKDGDDAVGEDPEQDPKGYRIILDGAIPAVKIEGEVMTIEDAAKAGYLVPAVKTVFDEFTYDKGKAKEALDEENFVETAQVYAEIEMNEEKTAAERKLAVGNIITGHYYFETYMGQTPFYGQVEITKPLGSVDASAEIIWTYEEDADVDHNKFYETGEDPQIYSRTAYEIDLDADDVAYLKDKLALELTDFAKLTPNKLTIQVADKPAEGAEPEFEDLADDATFAIEEVVIKDGKLVANFVDFEWDKIYKVVAVYNGLDENDKVIEREGMEEFPANITVTGILTTIDRNREPVVLGPYEHTFIVNGEEYYDGYYHWESDPLYGDIFKAFDEEGVINVKGEKHENGDFEYDAEKEEFAVAELEGKLKAAADPGTAKGYIDIKNAEDVDVYAWTMKTVTPEILAGDIFSSGKRSEEDPNLWLGNTVTRNITTYIGEEVQFSFIFNYKVPDYNFLHLRFYTFNKDEEVDGFVTKRDFADNDGSVLWWTQVNPSYFTSVATPNTSETEAQKRESFRHALADYDVSYINLAELAFNVVDENDDIIEDADLEELGLKAKFIYTDETQGDVELPEVDQIDPEFLLYKSLWVDNTVFYYRTNEKKFIPALGTLTLTVGEVGQGGYPFPVATRFEFPKNAVKEAFKDVELDYSTYAMVRWTPFKAPKADGFTIVLDENKIYREPLFKGMELKDNRPNNVSYYVIKDGEWVVGNVAEWDSEAGTYTTGGNGYVKDIAANDAYHITTDFVYDTTGIPAELKKLLSIKYSSDGVNFVDEKAEGLTPYVVYDYTSEVQFHGVITIPVVVVLDNPWQEQIKFVYDITIKGFGD